MHRGAYGILGRPVGIDDLTGGLPLSDGLYGTGLSCNDKELQTRQLPIWKESENGGGNAGTRDLATLKHIEDEVGVALLIIRDIVDRSAREQRRKHVPD
jgi:hypothetical protein